MTSKWEWSDAVRQDLIEKYPELAQKADSVALATYALIQDPTASPDSLRHLSKETGIRIAGRALGSARRILGLSPTRVHGRRWASPNGHAGLGEIADSLRKLELERLESQRALRKIRDLLDDLLDRAE